MPIKVVIAKAHAAQRELPLVQQEIEAIETSINRTPLPFTKSTVNFAFIGGNYQQIERKMLTTCLFINCMEHPINELHGVLRLKFKEEKALIAKATIDFDELFMGVLNPSEALLIHIDIPVKGLSADAQYSIANLSGNFEDVRVSFINAQ